MKAKEQAEAEESTYGELTFDNGDYYVGDIKDGEPHGEGTILPIIFCLNIFPSRKISCFV